MYFKLLNLQKIFCLGKWNGALLCTAPRYGCWTMYCALSVRVCSIYVIEYVRANTLDSAITIHAKSSQAQPSKTTPKLNDQPSLPQQLLQHQQQLQEIWRKKQQTINIEMQKKTERKQLIKYKNVWPVLTETSRMGFG